MSRKRWGMMVGLFAVGAAVGAAGVAGMGRRRQWGGSDPASDLAGTADPAHQDGEPVVATRDDAEQNQAGWTTPHVAVR